MQKKEKMKMKAMENEILKHEKVRVSRRVIGAIFA